jgi:hypothetical protein
MKASWIISAAVALGTPAVIPTVAHADPDRSDRYDRNDHRDRDYRDRHYRDFDEDIDMRDVPRDVRETARRESRGRRIESVQYVHRDGKFFYRFRIDDPGWRDRDTNIRVAPGGRLLSVEEAGRYDPDWRKHFDPHWHR